MQFPYSWRFLLDLQIYCILQRILPFDGLLIHEGCWIYEVLVGFKPTPTKRTAKYNRYLVVKSYISCSWDVFYLDPERLQMLHPVWPAVIKSYPAVTCKRYQGICIKIWQRQVYTKIEKYQYLTFNKPFVRNVANHKITLGWKLWA